MLTVLCRLICSRALRSCARAGGSRIETTFETYVLDRSVFMIDPAEVRTMVLSTADRRVVVRGMPPGKLEIDTDTGACKSKVSLDRIRDAFLEMRAEGVVHLGEAAEDEGIVKPLLDVLVHRNPGHHERSKDIHLSFGRGNSWRSTNVYYARRDGIGATYAVAASRVKPVLEALGIE